MIIIRKYFPLFALLVIIIGVGLTLPMSKLEPADYTIFNGTESKTLDPAIATGVPEGRVLYALYEGLCSHDPKTLEPTQGVAERWEKSADQKTYRFFLRNDAKWSDGTPLTSEDFVWSFRRMLHPATAAQYSYELYYLINGRKYTKGSLELDDRVEIDIPKEYFASAEKFASTFNIELKQVETSPMNLGHYRLRGVLKKMKAPPSKEVDTASNTKNDEKKPATAAKTLPTIDFESTVFDVEINGKVYQFLKRGDGTKKPTTSGNATHNFAYLLIDSETIGIRAVSPLELEITLEHPVPYFLDLMAFYTMFPVNRKCIEKYGRNWVMAGNLVTNGPFKLESRRIRERIRVIKNEHYWDRDKIHLNRIDFLSAESTVTSLNFYLTGQADWLEYAPVSTIPTLLEQKRPDFQPQDYISSAFYRFNISRVPLNNKKMRQALNMAIDKQLICDKILQAGQKPARNFVSTVVKAHKPALCPEHDPKRAKELMDEAIQELQATGDLPPGTRTIKLSLQFNSLETNQMVAEFIQSEWQKNLGIQVELNQLEWGAFQANERNIDFQVSRGGWIGDYLDASTFLGMFITDEGNNCTNWSNARYDELIALAKEATDPDKRRDYFHEAEAILMEEMPIMPLYFGVTTSMSRTYVKGTYPNYHNLNPLKGVWIDKEEKERVLRAEAAQ